MKLSLVPLAFGVWPGAASLCTSGVSLDFPALFPCEVRGAQAEDVEGGIEGEHLDFDCRRRPCFKRNVTEGS